MPSVYLLFGSNVGNRVTNVRQAILSFVGRDLKLLQVSYFYETAAWGNEFQPSFLNVCARYKTELHPKEVLQLCKEIEERIGRQNRGRWQEREIDIDILYYGKKQVNDDDLIIPHPRLIQRNFALIPLKEISPTKKHPVLHLTTTQLVKLCTDEKAVQKLRYKPKV